MNSLLDGVRELVTPALLARTSAHTGESEAATLRGFGMAIPALLASLANRSGETTVMGQIASLAAAETGIESDPIARANLARAAAASRNTTAAEKWLAGANGDNLATAADGIARRIGVRGSSAGLLLSIAAPLVLGHIGRLVRSESLDGAGLAARLFRERGTFAAAAQNGLEGVGIGTRKAVEEQVPAAPSSRGWAVPLLCGVLAFSGLLWWLNRERPAGIDTRVRDAATSAVGTTGSTVATLTRTLPGNIEVRIPRGSMEDRLLSYLSAPSVSAMSFNFDRIGFGMASASLTPESREQLSNAAAILRAYPNARVVIAGYTDNRGDPAANLELSRSRAMAVRNTLQEMGVSPTRLRAEGYGSQNPVADNSTEAGRARNRRVTLRVSAS
jgi:outer membrane protein OmpA-like peptidoglycan-associated protein